MIDLDLADRLTDAQQDGYIHIVAGLTSMTTTVCSNTFQEALNLSKLVKLAPSEVIKDFYSKREWKAYYIKLLEKQLQFLRSQP